MLNAAIEASSTYASLIKGLPATTTTSGASEINDALCGLHSDSLAIVPLSSTAIKVHECLFLEVGESSAASKIFFVSSGVNCSFLYFLILRRRICSPWKSFIFVNLNLVTIIVKKRELYW